MIKKLTRNENMLTDNTQKDLKKLKINVLLYFPRYIFVNASWRLETKH